MEEHELNGALYLFERCLRMPTGDLVYPDATLILSGYKEISYQKNLTGRERGDLQTDAT